MKAPDLGTEDPESPLQLRDQGVCRKPRLTRVVGHQGGRPAAGRYGVTVTTENMPALKWPGMLQTKR